MIVRAETPEQRRTALTYLAGKLDMKPDAVVSGDAYEAFFMCRGTEARGVVLYKNCTSGDIEMMCAGEPGWVTRPMMRFVFDYPFNFLGCNRVTCLAHRKNKAMRKYLERMGFSLEGVKRKAVHGADLMIYGILKKEAKRWD